MMNNLIGAITNAEEAKQMELKGSNQGYLSPRLLANQFIGEDNEGLMSISEYSRFLRYMNTSTKIPLIADGQSGFGNQLNSYYASKDLSASGANHIILNDQRYPAHSNQPNQFISKRELLGKILAMKDGTKDYNTDIWLKLDGDSLYGLDELNARIALAKKAGIKQIIIGHINDQTYNRLRYHPDIKELILAEDNYQIRLNDLKQLSAKAIIPTYSMLQAEQMKLNDLFNQDKQLEGEK